MHPEKDWTGNSRAVYVTNGDSSHSEGEREINDYYATDPKAVEMLMQLEQFDDVILEPCCGEGHISEVLKKYYPFVESHDLIDRGYGEGPKDFLTTEHWPGDIITNPPYKYASDFVRKAMEIIDEGHKVAMFLKLTFLEGKARANLFADYPPKRIWVSRSRLNCGKNGVFVGTSAVCFAWFVWEKGFTGDPVIKWFN